MILRHNRTNMLRALAVIVAVIGLASQSSAQQVPAQAEQVQQLRQVSVNQVQQLIIGQIAEEEPQLAELALVGEPVLVAAISPEEHQEIQDCIHKLQQGLAPETGDNLLADVWDLENGRIVRSKRGLNGNEEIVFDPQNDRLKDWFVTNLSRATVNQWAQGQIYPISVSRDQFVVTLQGRGLQSNQVTFVRTRDGMKIVKIEFKSYSC